MTNRPAAWWAERNLPGQKNPDLADAETPWTVIVHTRKGRKSARQRRRAEARGERTTRRRQFGALHAQIVQAGRRAAKGDTQVRDRSLSGKARRRARKEANRASRREVEQRR